MKRIILVKLLILIMATHTLLYAQVDRIEPPCWWTGMKNPALQLMVHGKNIAACKVEINYAGIEKKSVNTSDNPNYLFIDLMISPEAKPGKFEIRFLREGAVPISCNYELLAREQGSSSRQGFTSADVIYLFMPDRFANGDPSNDSVKGMKEGVNRKDPSGRHGGDIQGIIDHMDYFSRLGITALWITPLIENNQKRTSYHGYAMTDFYKVDPRFGTNEDYRQLVQKANEQGIKVIMDFVFNHCGSEHWWISDMPARDWINDYPDYHITNHRRTVNMDSHASEYDRERMRNGWFVPSMPDLNQKNPFLAEYLIQNSIWWVEYLGLQGIRMDTYPYNDKYFMARWCRELLDEYPHFTMVGEEWSENPAIVSYWQRGQVNKDGYQGNLPSLMDFPLQTALSKALTEKEDWGSGWVKLYEAIACDFLYPDPKNLVVIADNHDMNRFYMQLGMDSSLYRLGITYLLTTRGIPQLYYGSEILMTHTEGNTDSYRRKDFPGGWQGDPVNAFTGKGLTKKEREMQAFFTTLLNWRKNNPVIHTGRLIHFAPANGIYVYFRVSENNKVMVVLNKNRKSTSLALDRFHEVLDDMSYGKDVLTDQQYVIKDSLIVPGRTPLILELK
jgi:glycosidase